MKTLKSIVDTITRCMVPIIPLFIAGGFVKIVAIVLVMAGVLDVTASTYVILNAIGDAPFYFLPLEIAYTAAKHFNTPVFAPLVVVGALFHPDFVRLVGENAPVTFAGMAVGRISYGYCVLPVILLVYIIKRLQDWLGRNAPPFLNDLVGNSLVMVVAAVLMLVALGPAGHWLAERVHDLVVFAQAKDSVLASGLFILVFPLLVVTGLHWPFVLDAITNIGTNGFDMFYMVAMLANNLAQGGAALAVGLRAKTAEVRKPAFAAAVSGILTGVCEPALIGINIKLRRPLIAALAGSVAGAMYGGWMLVKAFVFVPPCVTSILIFTDIANAANLFHAFVAGGIALGVSFSAGLALGFREPIVGASPIPLELPAEEPAT